MKHIIKTICSGTICYALLSCGIKEEKQPQDNRTAIFCHIPFDVSTSIAMTPSHFSETCSAIGEVSVQDERYTQILALIKKSKPGPFLDFGVRVKITVAGSEAIYIDDIGGVIMGASQAQIDPDDFKTVKKMVTKMAKQSEKFPMLSRE